MKKRLLVLDMDDTLLNDQQNIPIEVLQSLQSLKGSGIQVMLASGRSPESMHPYALEIGKEISPDAMICYNGAQIIRISDLSVLEETQLSPEESFPFLEYLLEEELFPQYYRPDRIVASSPNSFTELDSRICKLSVDTPKDFLKSLRAPVSKFVVSGKAEKLAKAEAFLKEHFSDRLRLIRSKPFFIELLPIDADKGLALEFFCKSAAIDLSEVWAAGDALNDEGLLKTAGTGVAMQNAVPAIRNLADIVCPLTNNENGVAWIVSAMKQKYKALVY